MLPRVTGPNFARAPLWPNADLRSRQHEYPEFSFSGRPDTDKLSAAEGSTSRGTGDMPRNGRAR